MDDERFDVVIMGRTVGSASGYDQVTDDGFQFYDFYPVDALDLIKGSDNIYVDFITGLMQVFDATGEPFGDLVDIITWMQYIKPTPLPAG